MRAYVIRLRDDEKSQNAADHLRITSDNVKNEFKITDFDAMTPDRVKNVMKMNLVNWTYPWEHEGGRYDLASGLWLNPYKTATPAKRMACFMSHFILWRECSKNDTPYLIFEHDAEFTRKLDLDLLENSKYGIIALNDPRGATKKSQLYYDLVKEGTDDIVPVPKIEDLKNPQGLPGNSAYYIKPQSARFLVELTKRYGAWPNDALMCQQLMPKQLGILRNFTTKVQGLSSSTTL